MQLQFPLQPYCLMFESFLSAQIPFYNHLHVLFLFILAYLKPTQIPSDLLLLNTFIHLCILFIIGVYLASTSQGCWSPSEHTWGKRQEPPLTARHSTTEHIGPSLTHQGTLAPQSINLKFTSWREEAAYASQRRPV